MIYFYCFHLEEFVKEEVRAHMNGLVWRTFLHELMFASQLILIEAFEAVRKGKQSAVQSPHLQEALRRDCGHIGPFSHSVKGPERMSPLATSSYASKPCTLDPEPQAELMLSVCRGDPSSTRDTAVCGKVWEHARPYLRYLGCLRYPTSL